MMSEKRFTIDLEVDRSSGVLGKAGALLLRTGLKFRASKQRTGSRGEQILSLEVTGDAEPEPETLRALGTLTGVQGRVSVVSTAHTDPPRTDPAMDRRLQPWVEAIVTEWPRRLVTLLEDAEAEVATRDRPATLRDLGSRVGARLSANPELGTGEITVAIALERVALPLLDKVARGQVNGGALEILLSVFNRPDPRAGMDLVLGAAEEPCYFLTGWIDGALGQCPGLPRIRVEEPRCRKRGDPFCQFKAELL